jgi:metallo-beta-lactamase family protein
MKLRFLGAAQTVTGSKYLLETPQHKVLIDAGLFQGSAKLEQRNGRVLPIEPADVDAVLLTHSHIDHTGYLPKLVKDGLSCPVHCTHGTRDLTGLLLLDSASIQEEDLTNDPLYSLRDVESAFHLITGHKYQEVFRPLPNVSASFHDAGHILGSSWIDLRVEGRRFVFSGDLGKSGSPLLKDPERPRGRCDVLLLESTYGNRRHRDRNPEEYLKRLVRGVARRGGNLIIPAFAVERTQEIVYLLEALLRDKDIPPVGIFIDSPMASRATLLFRRYENYYDDEASDLLGGGAAVLEHPKLRLCQSVEQSKEIGHIPGPKIIIAASGMATSGRVLHHLHRELPDRRNHVLLVGFQAPGTRGHQLERGKKKVEVLGDKVPVKASVSRLEGFSGHADKRELLRWARGFSKPPGITFLVHGEPKALEAQRKTLTKIGWNVKVPQYLQNVNLESYLGRRRRRRRRRGRS